MDLIEKITELTTQHLPGEEYFVVDVKASASKIRSKVTILIDSDAGIGIDDLGKISRAIEEDLEEVMTSAYTLEVSSPGVDTPLAFARMYKKNIGRNLKVVFNDGLTVKGELAGVSEESFVIMPEKKKKEKVTPPPSTIAYADVKEAKVEVSFK
ncbi:MAG: ribosome maturation factor RimP [Spirosomaceae bacterium]|nr:ribosome maturation factor RimP [Spirosomataceae bacterium]